MAVATFGVGKVNTAAGLALAIARLEPVSVIQVGIGGAFPGFGLSVGDVAVASEETHLDSGVITRDGFEGMERMGLPLLTSPATYYNRIPVDRELSSEIAGGVHPLVPFGTSETVTGVTGAMGTGARFEVAVESMEGAAAAQVALALEAPFAEVRGISNTVGERDKARWRIAHAVEMACLAVVEWLHRSGSGEGR